MPTTPTPMPSGSELFHITYSLWGSMSSAVQVWHWLGDWANVLQLLLLLLAVGACAYIAMAGFRQMTRKDSEE